MGCPTGKPSSSSSGLCHQFLSFGDTECLFMMIMMLLGDLIQRTAKKKKLWWEDSLLIDSGEHSELVPAVEQV